MEEMQRKMTARLLSDLPESILIHILSMLPDGKQVVRTCLVSKRWRFLWKFVPVSLFFVLRILRTENAIHDFIVSTHRELHYWRSSSQKIRKFTLFFDLCDQRFVKDVDLWVHFATKQANVEELFLGFFPDSQIIYEFPQFAYKNSCLRSLILWDCRLNVNVSSSVNWSSLVSLFIMHIKNLKDGVMEKVLSGCPNLECLQLETFRGIHRLEISNVKLRKLIISDFENVEHDDVWLEILAPYIQNLKVLGSCHGIRVRNVTSLVSAILNLNFDFGDGDELQKKESSCLKELLRSVAHVENLELGPWCIECLSILELEGWQFPPSSRKFLKLDAALEQLDFPGICSFLQGSADLETLIIDWCNHKPRHLLSRYTNEDEQSKRFKTLNCNCSLLHLKTIKVINFDGPLSGNKSVMPLVKYLLKNATMLEKFIIATKVEGSDMSQDYVKMAQEFQSFPRSSLHASVVFSY